MTTDATDPDEGSDASAGPPSAERDVVVVGGGVAGLSAAVY
ncbi:thioredoxin reductase, partial [Halorubrum sp. SS5]